MSLLLASQAAPFDPATGFPYSQPQVPMAHFATRRAISLSLVACAFVPLVAGFDPSTGYAWPQPEVPVRRVARATALLSPPGAAFVFVPPPFDPSTGFPWPQAPEVPNGKRRAEGLRPNLAQPPPQFGTAVRFNGVSQNNGLQRTSNLFGPTNFTVTTFFYLPTIPGADASLWMLQDTNGTSPTAFINCEITGGTLGVAWSVGGFQALGSVVAKQWYFVAVTVGAGGSGTAYWGKVGTAPASQALGPGMPTGFTPASFTLDTDWFTEPLDGRLCSVKVWDAVLSAGEAALEATKLAPARTSNIRYWYKLEHASTKLFDSSGFGRDLTAIGAGSWSDEEGPFLQDGPWDSQFGPFEPPSEVTRQVRRVTQHAPSAFVPVISAAPLPLDWLPIFPPQLQRRVDRPLGGAVLPLARQPIVDWLPSFPDFARGLRRPLNVGGPGPTSYARQPVTDWLPDFPDFARAVRRALNVGGAAALVRRQPEVDLEWMPQLPAFIARARAAAPLGFRAFVPLIAAAPALPLWAPVFPDLLFRPVVRPHGLEVHPLLVVVQPVPLLPLWAPIFPVFITRGRELLGAWLRPVFRISDFTTNTFEGGYTRAVMEAGSATSAQTSPATKAVIELDGQTTAETTGRATSAEVIGDDDS